jgi:uncharacterized protein YegL
MSMNGPVANIEGGRFQRNLVTLIIDASASMGWSNVNADPKKPSILDAQGRTPIQALEAALHDFLGKDLQEIAVLRARGEIAIGLFYGTPELMLQWLDLATGTLKKDLDNPYFPVAQLVGAKVPSLLAEGGTPLIDAVYAGFEASNRRRAYLRAKERVTMQYAPNIILITDGQPTTRRADAPALGAHIKSEFDSKRLRSLFVALGVQGADETVLKQIAPDSTFMLGNIPIATVLKFVTATLNTTMNPTHGVDGQSTYDNPYAPVQRELSELFAAYANHSLYE